MDYKEYERRLRVRRDSPRCVLTISKHGRHPFGGKPNGLTIRGAALPKPIHHFVTIDTTDPLCGISSDLFTRLPLVYPLLYGAGGGEIQYSVLSNDTIEVHHLSKCYEDDPYVEHDELPEATCSLRELSYGEYRLLCALDGHFDPKHLSVLDKRRLQNCQDGKTWRFGGHFRTCQGAVWALCRNPECDWASSFGGNTKSQIRPIALLSASKRQLGDIWGQYSEDVEFYFGYCPHCGTIHAVNRCT